ncbi:MAG: heptosyltransferase, partial [Acidobacteriota bacterium]|nr:heptosyltransferase [Acidobacteriota bacterium]
LNNIFQITGQLKKYRFESGILFTNSFHSALLFKLAGVSRLTGYSKDLRGFLLDKKIQFPRGSRDKEKHHIYFYLDLATLFIKEKKGAAAIIDKKYSDELPVPPAEKENARALFTRLGINPANKHIGISPSAAFGTAKQWPAERFGQLIDRIAVEIPGAQILLLGSAGERERIARIIDMSNARDENKKANLHNLAGVLKLGEAIAAISLCHVFVSNDSGLMHVAYSLNVPLIAIFGPTRPHKTGPLLEYHPQVKILHHPPACAPCNDRDCPTDHACMNAVTVDEVLEAIHALIEIG